MRTSVSRRLASLAAILVVSASPASPSEGEVATELLKVTVTASPSIQSNHRIAAQDSKTFTFGNPKVALDLTFTLTWLTEGLPGSLQQVVEARLKDSFGRTVATLTGGTGLKVRGVIPAGPGRFSLELKNANPLGVNVLKVKVSGRAG